MKKYMIFLLALLCYSFEVLCQSVFPEQNAIWNVYLECPNEGDKLYGVKGDTMINNLNYSRVFLLTDTLLTSIDTNNELIGFLRNEEQKVLFRPKYGNIEEFVLYDFSKSVGDTIWHNARMEIQGSIISFNSEKYVSIVLDKYSEDDLIKYDLMTGPYDSISGPISTFSDIWIQGIGSTKGLFWHLYLPSMACEGDNNLKCVKYNDEVIYLNDARCNQCFCSYLTGSNGRKNDQGLVKLFPNPAQDLVVVFSREEVSEIWMFNSIGKKILLRSNLNSESTEFFTSDFPAGLYYVSIELTSGKKEIKKLIIE
jgi:hypothetical protein